MVENRITARDLVCSRFATLPEDAILGDALAAFVTERDDVETGCTLLVIGDDGAVRGLLPSSTLVAALVGDGNAEADTGGGLVRAARERLGIPVVDVMIRDVPAAGPDDPLLRLAELTAGAGRECVPLVEDGHVVGVVRLGEVFLAMAGLALAPRNPGPPAPSD